MTIEEQLVRHIRETTFSDLPDEVVDAARREVLWALGTSVGGAGAEGSDMIMSFVRQQGGREESTILGFGDRAPAILAGFANGAFAKALEYEDKFWMDESHGYAIGAAVVPAAFAAAEHLGGRDGKSVLAAVALATDVQARLVIGAPDTINTACNSTYIFSVFGATVAAAKLMELDEEQTFNARGLGNAQAAGSRQATLEGALGVRIQMGFGVRNQNYIELARKVDSDMDDNRHGVWVEMRLTDGSTLRSPTVLAARGHPDNPQSTEEMVEKYRDCVQYGPKPLTRARTEQAKDMILHLHEVSDATEIMRLLG